METNNQFEALKDGEVEKVDSQKGEGGGHSASTNKYEGMG